MKNIIKEKANVKLIGRLKKTFHFVEDIDIKNKVIVDIGCGYGWFELNAFKKGAKKIVGLEISEKDLETIKKHIKNKNFSPIVGDASNISVKDKSVDTVVAWEVIEHIPKGTEKKFFKEVARVLKKGGAFYLSTPYDSIMSKYFDPAFWLVGHRHYSYSQLKQYGLHTSFRVEKKEIAGGFWTIYSIIDMYFWKWIIRKESLLKKFLEKEIDKEYNNGNGYANIFVKFIKR